MNEKRIWRVCPSIESGVTYGHPKTALETATTNAKLTGKTQVVWVCEYIVEPGEPKITALS